MIELQKYMQDGANWQAQCVLAYVRGNEEITLDEGYESDKGKQPYSIAVGRWENGREQGYVFTLRHLMVDQLLHVAVFEHRNSDEIVVSAFTTPFLINTPTYNDVNVHKQDVTYMGPDKVIEAGELVCKKFKETMLNHIKQKTKEEMAGKENA